MDYYYFKRQFSILTTDQKLKLIGFTFARLILGIFFCWGGRRCPYNTGNTACMFSNGDFYVALGFRMGLALLVWVGGGRVLYFFGNEPRLGQKSPILHRPLILQGSFYKVQEQSWPDALPDATNGFHKIQTQNQWVTFPVL